MATNVSLQAVEPVLHPVPERGWRNGLANLLGNELRAWWGTRTWLVHALIWTILLNGSAALVLWTGPRAASLEAARTIFSLFTGIFGALGVIVATQGAIVGEVRQGTAAWVLSKPVSRLAFLAAKWLAHGFGFFVTIILLQGALAYAQFSAAGGAPPPLAFLGGMGLLTLQLLGYLTLTLMLGTFFGSQAVVAGIATVLLFVQPGLAEATALGSWLPGALPRQVAPVLGGEGLSTLIPLIGTVLLIVVCALLAIWRFAREEF